MKKYKVSREIINMWYNILGMDENINYQDKEYYYFDDLSEMISSFYVVDLFSDRYVDDAILESNMYSSMLNSLIQIHDNMALMAERLEDDDGIIISLSYEELSIILNAVTSLDLLLDEDENEDLRYFRVERIQQVVLKELSMLETELIFLISDLVLSGKIESLLEFKEACPGTVLFLVKFLLKDMDIADHEIFMDNSNMFSLVKLYDVSLLASKNKEVKVDDDILNISKSFKRLSYSKVRKIMSER